MKITDIRPHRKGLTLVVTDEGEFEINSETLSQTHLVKGATLSQEEIKALLERSEFERAKSRAIWYISRGDLTHRALCEKLKRSFSASTAQSAAERMEELGLIDDRKYAENLVRILSDSNVSKNEISRKLFVKGVPRDIAKEALDSLEVDAVEQIRALISQKYRTKLETEDGVKKVYAALVRKGFSYGDVKEALRKYSENLDYSEDF